MFKCWHLNIYEPEKWQDLMIKLKIPSILTISTSMSNLNFMLNWVEHKKVRKKDNSLHLKYPDDIWVRVLSLSVKHVYLCYLKTSRELCMKGHKQVSCSAQLSIKILIAYRYQNSLNQRNFHAWSQIYILLIHVNILDKFQFLLSWAWKQFHCLGV